MDEMMRDGNNPIPQGILINATDHTLNEPTGSLVITAVPLAMVSTIAMPNPSKNVVKFRYTFEMANYLQSSILRIQLRKC